MFIEKYIKIKQCIDKKISSNQINKYPGKKTEKQKWKWG